MSCKRGVYLIVYCNHVVFIHSKSPRRLLPILSCVYLALYSQNACMCVPVCVCVCVCVCVRALLWGQDFVL